MLSDPKVQIAIGALVALVLIAAIVWGKRRVRIKVGGVETTVEDQERKVNVAEQIRLDGVKAGNIIGSRAEGDRAPATDISVARGADIRNSEIGDIVGEVIQPTAPKKEP